MKRNCFVKGVVTLLGLGSSIGASASPGVDIAPFVEALQAGQRLAKTDGAGDPNDEADIFRYVLQQASEGYRFYFETDPQYPEWVEGNHYPHGNAGNSPDTRYAYTRIEPDGVYRIWGKRNTVSFVVLQVGKMGYLANDGKPLDHYSLDDLTKTVDGSFELVLSPTRPSGYKGDWRKLDAEAALIYLRQVMLDWKHEKDADIYIERLDKPAERPRLGPDDIRARTQAMFQYTRNSVRVREIPGAVVPVPPTNNLQATTFSNAGGLAKQMYHWGYYDISVDDALIVEGAAPSTCRFWNFQVTDIANVANDYMYRQTHLNKVMLSVDNDQRFRLVVSLKDPGVANWIDTAGHSKGVMLMRSESCATVGDVTVRKVPFAQVAEYLLTGTRRVTEEERGAALRERRELLRARLRR